MSDQRGFPARPLEPETPLKRRGLLVGAGAAGAAAVAATALPVAVPEAAAVAAAPGPVDGAAGYRLSAHVLRYYETART